MDQNIDIKVLEFKTTFSKTAKNAINDKNFILEYCIVKRAWKDAVIREKFNKESNIIKNKSNITAKIKNELLTHSEYICKNFDEWHNSFCELTDYGMRYGVWQKFINMIFKNLYCVKELFPEYDEVWNKCHCPIDTVISEQLYNQLKLLNAPEKELELSRKISRSNQITWNNISKENYIIFQNQVLHVCKQQNITPLQFDFKYWNKK